MPGCSDRVQRTVPVPPTAVRLLSPAREVEVVAFDLSLTLSGTCPGRGASPTALRLHRRSSARPDLPFEQSRRRAAAHVAREELGEVRQRADHAELLRVLREREELLAVDQRAPHRQARCSRVAAGSSARISSGWLCAYSSDWFIAVAEPLRERRVLRRSSRAARRSRRSGSSCPSTGPGAITMRAPSMLSACERNGSGVQIASTWPFVERRAHRRERQREELDRVRVDAVLLERRLDHDLADALERVDGDRLAGKVGRRPDRASCP